MFKKKDEKKAPVPEGAGVLHQDLIIHNMPAPSRLSLPSGGASLSTGFTAGERAVDSSRQSKMVGIMIMVGGVILIAVMVFIGYQYMIKPAAKPAVLDSVPLAESTDTGSSELDQDEEAFLATSTDLSGEEAAAVATTTPIEEAATSTAPVAEGASSPVQAADSDADGLSDPEEAILGTDPLLADSDGDSYSDIAEIKAGYDPKGAGRLTGVWESYGNETYGYTISAPTGWPKQELSGGSAVIFTAPDESLFQISAQENQDRQSILSWYEQAFPLSELSYDRLRTGDGWEGIMGDDGLNFYLTDQNHGRIIVVSYISAENSFNYPFLFDFMISSLSLR